MGIDHRYPGALAIPAKHWSTLARPAQLTLVVATKPPPSITGHIEVTEQVAPLDGCPSSKFQYSEVHRELDVCLDVPQANALMNLFL